jgi:TfoX/Sxy family transcriptional regulator of competence genes
MFKRATEIGSATSRPIFGGAVFILVALLSGNAAADKVDDFKEAAGNDGCKAIPYQSERNACATLYSAKGNICKDYSCSKTDVSKSLDTYKEKLKNYLDAKSRKDDQAATSLEKTIKDLEEKLNADKKLGKERVEKSYDCLAAMELVQRKFSDVKKMVQDERDPALQSYVGNLVGKFEKGRDEHIRPMQDTTAAIENCKWVAGITW